MFNKMRSLFGKERDQDLESGRQRKIKKRGKIALFVTLMHILGVWTAAHAIMSTRTSQGAIAWSISAIAFPYIAVPAYWVFGQSKFDGYELLRRSEQLAHDDAATRAVEMLKQNEMLFAPKTPAQQSHLTLLENISRLPVTTGNEVKLLIDGDQTFAAILDGIDQAKDYILFQFYIVRDDGLGQKIKRALLAKAAEGVRVYFLYDELGSNKLSKKYIDQLRDGGVQVFPFNTTKGRGNRFRLNFRNHRKIVVIDGKVGFVGGHNVGDEYLGKDPVLSPWRDTHVELRGPVVQCVQVPFLEDWKWATNQELKVNWNPEKVVGGNTAAACLPTGPADRMETGTLWYLHAINSAQKRLWIVSPYFVPDEQLISALQLAALRGVEVKVLIPQNPDHMLVYLTAISYFEEAKIAGVEIYRYQPGFLHQKVMLIDDHTSIVGTHNLDNRSMRLNFEVTMVMIGTEFATEMENMLEADFAKSELASAEEYTESSFPYRFLIRAARLTAPVQ